jgi:hypothetical protein
VNCQDEARVKEEMKRKKKREKEKICFENKTNKRRDDSSPQARKRARG